MDRICHSYLSESAASIQDLETLTPGTERSPAATSGTTQRPTTLRTTTAAVVVVASTTAAASRPTTGKKTTKQVIQIMYVYKLIKYKTTLLDVQYVYLQIIITSQ